MVGYHTFLHFNYSSWAYYVTLRHHKSVIQIPLAVGCSRKKVHLRNPIPHSYITLHSNHLHGKQQVKCL